MPRHVVTGSLVAALGLLGLSGCGGGAATSSHGAGGATTTGATATGGGHFATSSSTGAATTSSSATSSSAASGGKGGGGAGTAGKGTGGAASTGTAGGAGGKGGGGGNPNANVDQDGDGWTPAQGDCCDTLADGCPNPKLVNPGAWEYPGNGIDDDCNPATPDDLPQADCSPMALMAPTSATDLLKAMDLCNYTTQSPPLPQRIWGVIKAELTLADGTGVPQDLQAGVMAHFGPNVSPLRGGTMAAISSGTARTPVDAGFVHPKNGQQPGQNGNFDAMTAVSAPLGYLAAHNNVLPSPPACPKCSGAMCQTAFDSVRLHAHLRVPTNVQSFSYHFKFYSAEFPEYVCQQYNDFFVALLTTGAMGVPADKNISFDANKNAVSSNNAFFQVCEAPMGAPAGTCPGGQLQLVGNGWGGWGTAVNEGGGTEWLESDAPVVRGEDAELEFIIWDAGDHNVDSIVLLDGFQWNVANSMVDTH